MHSIFRSYAVSKRVERWPQCGAGEMAIIGLQIVHDGLQPNIGFLNTAIKNLDAGCGHR